MGAIEIKDESPCEYCGNRPAVKGHSSDCLLATTPATTPKVENVSPVGSAIFPSPTTLPEISPFNQWVDRLSGESEIFDSSTSGPYNAMLLRGSIAERQPYWESVSDEIDTLSESVEKYGAGAVTVAASRYQVLDGSESGHCCFAATVIDTRSPGQVETVCECFTVEDAHLVARALNSIGKETQNEN